MTKLPEPDPSHIEHTSMMSAGEVRSALPTEEDQSRAGQMFGEFKLIRRLGKGGMAEVWLAEQSKPRRQVAVKFMHPELMNDPLYVKRFEREADAAAGLSHANIVQVYSTGTVENQHFIVQEFVEGQTLRDYLQKLAAQNKNITINAALQILRQTASALEAAAEKGIVHRDIKPENIMLTEKGMVKVADFGLAQIEQGGEKMRLTQVDTTMGTPLYMSPEQIRAEKLDQRSDLYSFGVMAYHMFSGQPPFRGESAMAVAVQHLQNVPPPLQEKRTDLPKPLADLVHRLLRKKPEERYQSFTEVLEDLRTLSKANKSGTIAEVQITDAVEISPARQVYGKRPWLTLALLVLLTGSASAGVGWWIRPKIGPPSEAPSNIKPKATAREQYLHAMLLVDNEEAWKAVKKNFGNSPKEILWVERSEEQLLLYYLKDKSRRTEAEAQIAVVDALRGAGDKERFHVEARFAKAYLAAGTGDFTAVRNIMQTDRSSFDKFLKGPWLTLYTGLRFRVEAPPGGLGPRPNQPGGRNEPPPENPRPPQ